MLRKIIVNYSKILLRMKFKDYSNYLNNRSKLSYIYRNYYLYPRIQKDLINPVLDVGCGIGDYLKFNSQATGVDINNILVKRLQKEGLNVYLIENNKISFDNGHFKSVILDNVLEHITKPKSLLRDIHRVLETNGILLIGLPGLKGFKNDPDHKKNYNSEELNKTIEPLGFKFMKLKKLPINVNFLSNVMKQFCIYYYYQKKP